MAKTRYGNLKKRKFAVNLALKLSTALHGHFIGILWLNHIKPYAHLHHSTAGVEGDNGGILPHEKYIFNTFFLQYRCNAQ